MIHNRIEQDLNKIRLDQVFAYLSYLFYSSHFDVFKILNSQIKSILLIR